MELERNGPSQIVNGYDDLSDYPFSIVEQAKEVLHALNDDSSQVIFTIKTEIILEICIMWDNWLLRREKGKRTKKGLFLEIFRMADR
jgi:hypothetical protein